MKTSRSLAGELVRRASDCSPRRGCRSPSPGRRPGLRERENSTFDRSNGPTIRRGLRERLARWAVSFRCRPHSQGDTLGWANQGPSAKKRLPCAPITNSTQRGGQVRRLNIRRGISILEVLVSLFVLSVGVLGVAALIPLGKLAMLEVEKSDRTGACGRSSLRQIQIRCMLDPHKWVPSPSSSPLPSSNVFVIDPLGWCKLTMPTLGGTNGIQRFSLRNSAGEQIMTEAEAESVFRWQDDLSFAVPSNTSTNGERPTAVKDSGGNRQFDGNFSWFLMVAASPGEASAFPISTSDQSNWYLRRQFSVSAVVCYKRLFTDSGAKPGETVIANKVKCDSGVGYGGLGIEFPGQSPIEVKRNEWVLLTTSKQTTWYRVVGVGYDNDNNITRMSLVGPDWHGGGDDSSASLVIVEGVTGVYTTTIQRDADGIWAK